MVSNDLSAHCSHRQAITESEVRTITIVYGVTEVAERPFLSGLLRNAVPRRYQEPVLSRAFECTSYSTDSLVLT